MDEINVDYTPFEFISATEYLSDNFEVSPNRELVENILKINAKRKITAKSGREEKLRIITNIRRIIAVK